VNPRARILPYADLGREAELFLDRYHPARVIPVPIEEIVELRMGLEIVPYHHLRTLTGVDAFVTRDCATVYVDADDYARDQPFLKFTFAEEAAHVWLHGEQLRNCQVKSNGDWLALRKAVKADPRFEWQAKDLAGLILVPPVALAAECRRACAVVRESAAADRQIGADVIRRLVLQHLVEKFKVSERVLEIRMNCDGLWDRVARSASTPAHNSEEVA